MTSQEKKVKDIRIDIVIAAYTQELIDNEIQYEFLAKYNEHTSEGKKMMFELNEKMKRRDEHFMRFGTDPYTLIDEYYDVFCSVEQEKVGVS
jgi:hypothetical protein